MDKHPSMCSVYCGIFAKSPLIFLSILRVTRNIRPAKQFRGRHPVIDIGWLALKADDLSTREFSHLRDYLDAAAAVADNCDPFITVLVGMIPVC